MISSHVSCFMYRILLSYFIEECKRSKRWGPHHLLPPCIEFWVIADWTWTCQILFSAWSRKSPSPMTKNRCDVFIHPQRIWLHFFIGFFLLYIVGRGISKRLIAFVHKMHTGKQKAFRSIGDAHTMQYVDPVGWSEDFSSIRLHVVFLRWCLDNIEPKLRLF